MEMRLASTNFEFFYTLCNLANLIRLLIPVSQLGILNSQNLPGVAMEVEITPRQSQQ
jgi:hypothetical protein